MPTIDPDLLRNAPPSPHRSALEHGYRWLRFEGALEQRFEAFYTATYLGRIRLSAWVTVIIFGLFIVIDMVAVPPHVAIWTISIRAGVIIPMSVLVLLCTYRAGWQPHLPQVVLVAALVSGLGMIAIIGTAFSLAYPIPYEGLLLVSLFFYLIASLLWRRALAVNLVMLLAFLIMEFTYQSDPHARMYQVVFMLAANVIGAYGGYFLERSIRTTFLANTLLKDLAALDGLTGLANRRTLNIHLERVWRQAQRDGHSIAVAMIDIDYFKRYNDLYGHAQGDAALKAVAGVVGRQARRPLDLAARYGGEEFLVVWYNLADGELRRAGEALNLAVAALAMEHQRSDAGVVTVSVGIASTTPRTGVASEALLRAADDALYQAKQGGRNRSVVAADLEGGTLPAPEGGAG